MNFRTNFRVLYAKIFIGLFTLVGTAVVGAAQVPSEARVKDETPKTNRARGLDILRQIHEILELKYHDAKFGGVDLDSKIKSAEERIKTLERNADIYRTIADALLALNDSHTTFYPPNLLYRVEYGFSMMMIANNCYVTDVVRGSDAEKQGLKLSDQIMEFSGFIPTRQNFWLINYIIYSLEPQEDIKLKVRGVDKKEREIFFKAKFISPEERKKQIKKFKDDEASNSFICETIGSEISACKLRTFLISDAVIEKMMKAASARPKLVLDLRGNGGGYVDAETELINWLFDREIKVGTEIARGKSKNRIANGKGKNSYTGEVIVLIDSQTGSAAEVVARVLQIEKRAKILGDASAGAVMTSTLYGIKSFTRAPTLGDPIHTPYYLSKLSISTSDFIINDGSRLEGIGVMPDLPVGPTQQAILDRSDPVLSYAAELLGYRISAEEAGKFRFLSPRPESLEDKTDRDISSN